MVRSLSSYVPSCRLSPMAQNELGVLEDGLWLIQGISHVLSSSRHLLLERRTLNFMECPLCAGHCASCFTWPQLGWKYPLELDVVILT